MTPFELLQRLCREQATGMLFAISREQRQARIGIVDGAIVHVTFAPRHGRAALELVTQISVASASFASGVPCLRHPDLPASDLVLSLLKAALSQPGSTARESNTVIGGHTTMPPRELPPETLPPAPSPSGRIESAFTSEQRRRLRDLLVEYVGPVADFLIERESTRHRSLSGLLDALARDITPPSEASAFKTTARAIFS